MGCEDGATVGREEADGFTSSDVCNNRGYEIKDENYNGARRDDTRDVHSTASVSVQTDNNLTIIAGSDSGDDGNDNNCSSNENYMLASPHAVQNMSESNVPQYSSNKEGEKVASVVPHSIHDGETLGRVMDGTNQNNDMRSSNVDIITRNSSKKKTDLDINVTNTDNDEAGADDKINSPRHTKERSSEDDTTTNTTDKITKTNVIHCKLSELTSPSIRKEGMQAGSDNGPAEVSRNGVSDGVLAAIAAVNEAAKLFLEQNIKHMADDSSHLATVEEQEEEEESVLRRKIEKGKFKKVKKIKIKMKIRTRTRKRRRKKSKKRESDT